MLTRILLPAIFVMMAGCVPKTIVQTDFCTGWKPVCASREDVLTDGTAKAIRAHDEHGAAMGCWKRETACTIKAN